MRGWSSCCGSPSRTRHRAGRRNRNGIRERELPGLVDEQDVERACAVLAGPDPAPFHRPRRARLRSRASCSARARAIRLRRRAGRLAVASGFWPIRIVDAALFAGLGDRIEEIPDHLVAVRGHADSAAGGDERQRSSAPRCMSCPSRAGPGSRGSSASSSSPRRTAASETRLALADQRAPASCPTRGGSRRSRSSAARYGPSASRPCSTTHSPIRSRLSRCPQASDDSRYGTRDVGWGASLFVAATQVNRPRAHRRRRRRARRSPPVAGSCTSRPRGPMLLLGKPVAVDGRAS